MADIKEAEIWYIYTYDLGRELTGNKSVLRDFLSMDSALAIIDFNSDIMAIKENGSVIGTDLVMGEGYFPHTISFEAGTNGKSDFHREKISELVTFKMAQFTQAFTGDYNREPDFYRAVLNPTPLEFYSPDGNFEVVFEPFIRMNYSGIIFIELRLIVNDVNVKRFVDLTNLNLLPIVGGGWTKEQCIINQHLAAIYHNIEFKSKSYKEIINDIEDYEDYADMSAYSPGLRLISFAFRIEDSFFLKNFAENLRYLCLQKLFGTRLASIKDFVKFYRSSYWQLTKFLSLRDFINQRSDNNTNYWRNLEVIKRVFYCVYEPEISGVPPLEDSPRLFDDYLVFVNPGMYLKIYNSWFRDYVRMNAKVSENIEFLNHDASTLSIIEYVLTGLMEREVLIDELAKNDKATVKDYYRLRSRLNYQKYLTDISNIASGEVLEFVKLSKSRYKFDEIENGLQEAIKALMDKATFDKIVNQNRVLISLTVFVVILTLILVFLTAFLALTY